MRILGLSAFYHDSAAALVVDGEIVAAAQEERFTRKKHDAGFPHHALAYCLEEAGLSLGDVDHVAFYDKPFLKFERLLETYLAFAPRGFRSFRMAMPLWLKEKLFQKQLLRDELRKIDPDFDWESKLLFTEHHQSHAASAFFPSPFDEAVVLTMDGVGEWATTSVGYGRGKRARDAQGDALSAFARPALFRVHLLHRLQGQLRRVQGDGARPLRRAEVRQAHSRPSDRPQARRLVPARPVLFRLLHRPAHDERASSMRCSAGRRASRRNWLDQRHMDLAASIQAVTEEVVLRLTRAIAAETGAENLCLAGGVALNCVANGKVLRDGQFKRIWIQPAAGDAGGALGAALAAYHLHAGRPRQLENRLDGMSGAYLGPAFDDDECAQRLRARGRALRAARRRAS